MKGLKNETTKIKGNVSNSDATVLRTDENDKSNIQNTNIDATRIKNKVRPNNPSSDINTANNRDYDNYTENAIRHDHDNAKYCLKDRFVLDEILGSGGMGVVYKAKDLLKIEANDSDPYVAIKLLGEEFKTHPHAFIALQRESRKSQRIAHPNIVNVYDFDRDGDVVFMTMEYMEGAPLDKLINQYKSTGLPTDEAWNIIKDICSALKHAHSENIIHSDFKPGNVFVTKKGSAKVFDFGIARAVSIVDSATGVSKHNHTVFDAGNLGALTPAYASLEMLKGEEPDIRDDIYALGCVAYELFTGEHPFQKLQADIAYQKGLKPRRIENISKRQWRAIEKALSFNREDRTSSIDDFIFSCFTKRKRQYSLVASIVIILLMAFIFINILNKEEYTGPDEGLMRNQLEYEIKIDLYKDNINNLLNKPEFNGLWDDSLLADYTELTKLLNNDDKWIVSTKLSISEIYLTEIEGRLKSKDTDDFNDILNYAHNYIDDDGYFIEKKKQFEKIIRVTTKKRIVVQEKNKINDYKLAFDNVNNLLKCPGRLNVNDLKNSISILKKIDLNKYQMIELEIINNLKNCIINISKSSPQRAKQIKNESMTLFNGHSLLQSIVIVNKDNCDSSMAGYGARGKRAICKDKGIAGAILPELVVIPGTTNIKPFAIGKYEVSNEEYLSYCKMNNKCNVRKLDPEKPVTELTINNINAYLNWLTVTTEKKYRLPTHAEWMHAAKSIGGALDPNRNCTLSSRGISKGVDFVSVASGKQNKWGLVNFVGNAHEVVFGKGRKLLAVGGSYKTNMDKCNIDSRLGYSGNADKLTSFRVLREL